MRHTTGRTESNLVFMNLGRPPEILTSKAGRWFLRIAFRLPLCEGAFERVWGTLERGDAYPAPSLSDVEEFLKRERQYLELSHRRRESGAGEVRRG